MKNIYIKAMEIGYNYPNGTNYNLLKSKVEKETEIFSPALEIAFIKWVSVRFSTSSISDNALKNLTPKVCTWLKNKDKADISYKDCYDEFSSCLWIIKGVTVKHYIDYLELKDSRKNAQQATCIAIIAIFLGLLTSIFQIYQGLNAPKPPFNVEIIEDKTNFRELEMENKNLKQ